MNTSKENREISWKITTAIKILENSYLKPKIELLSTEMYRLPPSKFAKAGHLGVDISINGIKGFFGCETNAEEICIWGDVIANDFINIFLDKPRYTIE
jgi:hypothetical protein